MAELGADVAPDDSDCGEETEEDPYQVYVLRRPHERSSHLVSQLSKQPEFADTRLRYRRIAPDSDDNNEAQSTYPRRFEFPNRPSLLESLTDDDSSMSSFVDAVPQHRSEHVRRTLSRSSALLAARAKSNDEASTTPEERRSCRKRRNSARFGFIRVETPPPKTPQPRSSRRRHRAPSPEATTPTCKGRTSPDRGSPVSSSGSGVASPSSRSSVLTSVSAIKEWDGRKICAPAALQPEQARKFALVPELPAMQTASALRSIELRTGLPQAAAVVRRQRSMPARTPEAAMPPLHLLRHPLHSSVRPPPLYRSVRSSSSVPLRVEQPQTVDPAHSHENVRDTRRQKKRRMRRVRRTSHRLRSYAVSRRAREHAAAGVATQRGPGGVERGRELSVTTRTRVTQSNTSATKTLRKMLKSLKLSTKASARY